MSEHKQVLKRYAYNIAGYTLLLTAVAIGWLPGPGFIPLALLGLYLLSLNNEWAARLRTKLLARFRKSRT